MATDRKNSPNKLATEYRLTRKGTEVMPGSFRLQCRSLPNFQIKILRYCIAGHKEYCAAALVADLTALYVTGSSSFSLPSPSCPA